MPDALAAVATICLVAALPAFGAYRICHTKRLTPKHLHICLLSVVSAALVPGPVYYLFSEAEYEASLLLSPEYCATRHGQCHFADIIFGNAWWLYLVISALLIYMLLRLVLAIKPNALSRTTAS